MQNPFSAQARATDSRSRNFEGESVEVDAIPPKALRQIVSDCITQHVNHELLEGLALAEHGEREVLMAMAQNYCRREPVDEGKELPF